MVGVGAGYPRVPLLVGLDLGVAGLERLVDAIEQEGAQRLVRRDVRGGKSRGREHEHAQQQAGAEREAAEHYSPRASSM